MSAGDHNGALKVACSHLGPLAANDQSLLKTLKETLLVLLQPDGTTPGKDLPLNDLANMLQVTMFFSFDLFFWFCLMNDQQTTDVCFLPFFLRFLSVIGSGSKNRS